ncbi:MAG TPA: CusA/CzcA family heavy metal efflux RND transporter [Oligoflexia bacterium]|nr:CusA/CzcA family heavy metal efflux RND transporter [Oligoflexia bacterium]HMP49145.1 CusA/CzcA family heavy metal efflux RND transporter [Oligoflexia bacterium]
MFNKIIKTAIAYRYLVLCLSLILGAIGALSYKSLIIDAVPDITNVQVQINSEAQGYSPFEVEQRITVPIELLISGLPSLQYTRSLSRYGLSQLTVVFEDGTDIHFARQLVAQRLLESKGKLPDGINPTLGPISTGLGEIFMYTVENEDNSANPRTLQELREVQDWVVKPQLRTIKGVVEINSIGGASKQITIIPNIDKLRSFELDLTDLSEAIKDNNSNVGAGFIEQQGEQFLIRVPSQVEKYSEIEDIAIGVHKNAPIFVKDIATVEIGSELRTGAATENGKEVVLGTVFMLMGENGRDVSTRVKEKLEVVSKSLPKGVVVKSVYDRATLVNATVHTVRKNLFEGALLVIVILFAALGNLRAALITACVIPLSMLMTIFGMVQWKMSANLMSLGALDFGLIVDGAVILVENCIKRFGEAQSRLGRLLTKEERLELVFEASSEVRQATMFGELIIMIVYVPILALSGVEGKMFHPMALTVLLALAAAFILSLTFVPAAVAIFVTGKVSEHGGWIEKLQLRYESLLNKIIRVPVVVVSCAVGFFLLSLLLFTRLGSEFIPSLDEGDVALHALRIPGTSLTQAIKMQHQLENTIKTIPEVERVFAKIGTAEIATDPMPPSVADGFVMLKPRVEWSNPDKPKADIVSEIEELVLKVPGNNYEFTQPIQMRFNELIAGVRSDVAVKVFGDDTTVLLEQGEKIKEILEGIPGASDTKVEQVTGLPMIVVKPDRSKISRLGLSSLVVQEVVKTAYAGEEVSRFYEGDRNFPVVVRLSHIDRQDISAISNLPIPLPTSGTDKNEKSDGIDTRVPELVQEYSVKAYTTLGSIADVSVIEGPNQITRENGKRRVVVTANVRNRDLGSFVEEAQKKISSSLQIPPGYWIGWGGQYENLLSAKEKLTIVVPLVLLSVFGLIFITFRSLKYTVLVFTGIPFALSGGILGLWLRDIPFSISAAVGFIALSGVSVLNGLVLVSFTKKLLMDGVEVTTAVVEGAVSRLRPVLMTAFVASLGFVPMALSEGTGSEVQRPLATVVIGGIISSTILTLLVLPVLIFLLSKIKRVNT